MLSPDDLFSDFTAARGLLVAVSGGPDSLALLALAADWSKGANRPPVYAATFDHGFRAASRHEALHCAALCAHLSIPHTILTWQGDKPTTRIQESARAARYSALVAEADRLGADVLLTGHHADDQMETILFRMMRGSSIGGLAGMQAKSPRGALVHARPLLQLRKAELVAFCEKRELAFVSDPSNEDPRFARTALRQITPALEAAGMGPEAFARLAERAARAEAALATGAEALRASTLLASPPGEIRLDGQKLAAAPEELALRVLMAAIAGVTRPARLEQAEPLNRALVAARQGNRAFRANLAGALVDLSVDGVIVISPEPPRQA